MTIGWLRACARWIAVASFGLVLLNVAGCAMSESNRLDALTTPEPDALRVRAMRRLTLATAYFEQGQNDVAQQEVRAALQIDPQFAEAYSLLGLIHQRDSAPQLAQQSFEQALRLASATSRPAELAAMQHNQAWFLCQQNRWDEAQALFTQALAQPMYRQQAKTWMALGLCQQRAGRLSEAQATLAPLNNSAQASAASLWLGIRLARALAQPQDQHILSAQLMQRFPHSAEAQALAQQKFEVQ